MPKFQSYRVAVTVEVTVRAQDAERAAEQAEGRVQETLDRHAKRLNAVAGADYGTSKEIE